MTAKFLTAFAEDGDKTEIPADIQTDGSISRAEGWGFDYSRNPSTDPLAKRIDRRAMNWLFYAITQALGQIQKTGAPDWITAADNGGAAFPYEQGAIVRHGGVTYGSVAAANTAEPGTDPTKWAVLDLSLFAPLVNPAFTGTPTAPDPAAGANGQQITTAAWVLAHIAAAVPDLSGYAQKAAANVWGGQQTPGSQVLIDGATVNWDVALGQVAYLTTAAARIISAPTNLVADTSYRLVITTGGFSPSWNAIFKFPNGGIPSGLSGKCIFDFHYDGTHLNCVGKSLSES